MVQVEGQVQHVEEEQELQHVDNWVGDKAQNLGLGQRHGPVMDGGFAGASGFEGFHNQCQRRAQHQHKWDDHGQHHVAEHVHGIGRWDVHAGAGGHEDCQPQRAQHPPCGAPSRPREAAAANMPQRVGVKRGENQSDSAKHDIEAELGEHVAPGWCFAEFKAHDNLHGVQVRVARRWRRGAAHGDGHTSGGGHDSDFDDGNAQKQLWFLTQLRDGDLAVDKAEEDQQQGQRGFRHDNQAVAGGEPIGEFNTNSSIDQARDGHGTGSNQREGGIAAHRHGHIGPQATAVGNQREDATNPQHHKHQVPEERVGAVVMVAAGGRVTFHAQRHHHENRQHKQHRLHGPFITHQPQHADSSRHHSGDHPDLGGSHLVQGHRHHLYVEHLRQRGSRNIRHDQWGFNQRNQGNTEGGKRASSLCDEPINRQRRLIQACIIFLRNNRIDKEG